MTKELKGDAEQFKSESKEKQKNLLIEIIQEDEKNGMYEPKNENMKEPKRVKKPWKSDKPFADFSDAISHFINSNCLRATMWDETTEESFVECDIRIHLNGQGGGYIHLLNQDSDTIDFRTMDHYKLTNTPKPEHLR